MCLFEDLNHLINLHEELFMVPPWVTTHTGINDAVRILHHDPLFIADNESSILFLNKIQDMDKLAMPLLYEFLLIRLSSSRAFNTFAGG